MSNEDTKITVIYKDEKIEGKGVCGIILNEDENEDGKTYEGGVLLLGSGRQLRVSTANVIVDTIALMMTNKKQRSNEEKYLLIQFYLKDLIDDVIEGIEKRIFKGERSYDENISKEH